MGPFHFAFIALNLILPSWLYFRTDATKAVEWKAWQANMTRLIEAGGGANCPAEDIAKKLRSLCEKSLNKQTNDGTITFEQDIGDHTYSCEARKGSLVLKISPAEVADPERKCLLNDARGTIHVQPAFIFTFKGFVNSMSFNSFDGERQVVSVASCRRKLKALKTIQFGTLDEFETALPASPNDPSDLKTANRFCWVYDAAPGWADVRRRYLEKSE